MKVLCFILMTLVMAPNVGAQTDPESVVQRQLDTYNAHDLQGFLATFSDDAKLFAFGKEQPVAEGKEALKKVYGELFERSPELHSTLLKRMVMGNKVLDHERIVGRNGSAEPIELIMVYVVKEGKIVEAHAIRP